MEVVTCCFRRVFYKNEQQNGLEIDEICNMEEATVSVKIDHVDIQNCVWATAAVKKTSIDWMV